MPFQINTNTPAIGAHRVVSGTQMSLERSMSRLSSGMRIVSAADDPSGLIAADNFRSQVTSIESATRNNQEAINYAKTAEGALTEINGLLNDARGLAIASGNNATLSAVQLQANQDQISSIIQTVNRISTNTQYGSRRMLDGSSGISAQISDTSRLNGLSIIGSVNGASITANGLISVTAVSVAATRGTIASAVLAGGVVLNAGSFTINGVNFSAATGETGINLAAKINASSNQSGIVANFDTATNIMTMQTQKFGSNSTISYSDASGVMSASGTNTQSTGVNAVATVNFPGPTSSLFTGGRTGNDGLTLSDADGNTIRLSEIGNVTIGWPRTVGQIAVGSASFQIGANANQTTALSLTSTGATQLGADLVAGVSLSSINVSSSSGATQALGVIDRSIEQIAAMRGRIGQFQRYALESNNRSLAVAKENMTAAESTIRDVDMASEMTQFTIYQVMQQAGMAMLGQANNLSQSVLSLLRQ